MAIETELDGYKRQIQKVQEQNEQLTYMYNRIESDIASVKKQIIICQNKHEALKIEYSTYNRTLYETEAALCRAQTVSVIFVVPRSRKMAHSLLYLWYHVVGRWRIACYICGTMQQEDGAQPVIFVVPRSRKMAHSLLYLWYHVVGRWRIACYICGTTQQEDGAQPVIVNLILILFPSLFHSLHLHVSF